MNKLGFCVKNMNKSQLVYELLCNLPIDNTDCFVFYEELIQVCTKPMCCVMNMSESWSFDGTLIATDISTANKISDYVCCSDKYFLVYDLEWIRLNNLLDVKHSKFADVYRNPELKLLCRSKDHQRVIEECWNVKVDIFNWEKLSCKKET